MADVPRSRPQWGIDRVDSMLTPNRVPGTVAVLGVRGYYKQTMGNPLTNDRGIYDDAMFIRTDTGLWSFNANCDPSVFRQGIANLRTGVWKYKQGLHGINKGNPYPAFVQADRVVVVRDGGQVETGWFGINIHRGGNNGTSSLGCQTLFPGQWDEFRDTLKAQLKSHGQEIFNYVLIEV